MANEKEMDEAIEEAKESQFNGLPEAPASANITVWVDGFRTQITMRDEKVSKTLEKIDEVIAYAKKKGWQPTWKEDNEQASPRSPKTPNCPKCSKPMVERTAKESGLKFWGCPSYPKCKGTIWPNKDEL